MCWVSGEHTRAFRSKERRVTGRVLFGDQAREREGRKGQETNEGLVLLFLVAFLCTGSGVWFLSRRLSVARFLQKVDPAFFFVVVFSSKM